MIKKRNTLLEEFSDKYHTKRIFTNAYYMAEHDSIGYKVQYKTACLAIH